MSLEDTSQSGEITNIFPLIENHPNKIVVDVGANDGFNISNSYGLIRLGWRGILIEPNPHILDKAREVHKDNPLVECLNLAASDSAGTITLYADICGFMGGSTASTVNTEETDWSRRWINRNETMEVEKNSLVNILSERSIPLDFALLSVDTEGHDLNVLMGLGEYRPLVILTERWDSTTAAKHELLNRLNYSHLRNVGCNEVFIRNNE